MQILVPKGRIVTVKFYKNVVLRKLNECQMLHPKFQGHQPYEFSVPKTQISSIWKAIQFKKCPWICGLSASDGCSH